MQTHTYYLKLNPNAFAGPFTQEGVRRLYLEGRITGDTLCCRYHWFHSPVRRLSDFAELIDSGLTANLPSSLTEPLQRPPLPQNAVVQDAPAPPQRMSKLGRILLISFCIAMGATVLGGMAGGGISAEQFLVKAFQYAIAGGIIFAIVRAFQTLK